MFKALCERKTVMTGTTDKIFLLHAACMSRRNRKTCQQQCTVTEAATNIVHRENTKEGQLTPMLGGRGGSGMLSKRRDRSYTRYV